MQYDSRTNHSYEPVLFSESEREVWSMKSDYERISVMNRFFLVTQNMKRNKLNLILNESLFNLNVVLIARET